MADSNEPHHCPPQTTSTSVIVLDDSDTTDTPTVQQQCAAADREVQQFVAASGGQTPAPEYEEHLGVQRHLLARAGAAQTQAVIPPSQVHVISDVEVVPKAEGKQSRKCKEDDLATEKNDSADTLVTMKKALGSAGRIAQLPVGVRSLEELLRLHDANNKNDNIPSIPDGPWNAANAADATEVLKKCIKQWCINLDTAGGGWGIEWEGFKAANGKRGAVRTAKCVPSKDDPCQKCPWRARFELSKNAGWVLIDGNNVHNCCLLKTQGEANARRATRAGIPETGGFLECGHAMAAGGCYISEIDRVLTAMAEDKGQEPSWTYSELRTAFLPSSSNHSMLDASGFVDWIMERKYTRGLFGNHTTDDAGRLNRAFFVLEDATNLWTLGGSTIVLLFDTTHGTNRYGLKVGLFVTVDAQGVSRILAVSIILNEDAESIDWVFSCFEDTFGCKPHVVLTDGDPTFAKVIKKKWPDAAHQLCTYHLSQNIVRTVRLLFGGKCSNSRFNNFVKAWWKIAKKTEYRSRKVFNDEWKELVDMVDKEYDLHHHLATAYTAAKSQLTRLFDSRHKWAARWTWEVFTAGCHSTQRQEAVHSGMKRWIQRAGCSLLTLAKQIVSYRARVQRKSDEKRVGASLTMAIRGVEVPPILTPFVSKVGGHAMQLMLGQFAQRSTYRMGDCSLPPDVPEEILGKPIADVSWHLATRIVTHAASGQNSGEQSQVSEGPVEVDAELDRIAQMFWDIDLGLPGSEGCRMHDISYAVCLTWCSCQFFMSLHLPCRHIFRLYDLKQDNHLAEHLVGQFWRIESTRCVTVTKPGGEKSRKYDRFARMTAAFKALALKASTTSTDTRRVLEYIAKQCGDPTGAAAVEASATESDSDSSYSSSDELDEHVAAAPKNPQVKTKGQPRSGRFVAASEGGGSTSGPRKQHKRVSKTKK